MANKKKADEALAKGAAEIKKAQKKQATAKVSKPEPVDIPKSTRDINDIVRDHVQMYPGHMGLTLDEKTPIEESLRILDWTKSMSDHVGFMIGDVLLFGENKWGDMYAAALNQTGRAQSTLWAYKEASKKIPLEQRVKALSFSVHRELLRLPDEKIATVLKEVGGQAEKGNAPTVAEVRIKVQKLTPRKVKKAGKSTSGKGKKGKAKPEPPPYEPTAEEQSRLDESEDVMGLAAEAVKGGKLYALLIKLDNKTKKRWAETIEPVVKFYNALVKATGY